MLPLKRDRATSPGTPPPVSGSKLDLQPFTHCKRVRGLTLEPASVSKASIRRLARRAGVKRISLDFYSSAETCLRRFLGGIVKDVGIVTEHARRRTVTVGDVLLVLKRNGRTLYGFEEKQRKRRLVQRLALHSLAESTGRVAGRAAASTPLAQPLAARSAQAERDAQPSAVAKDLPPATPAPQTPAPLTPDRAQQIQLGLSAFRDTVLERHNLGSSPLAEARAWVASELSRRGLRPCTELEFDVVVDALDRRNAVMIDGDVEQRVLYFL